MMKDHNSRVAHFSAVIQAAVGKEPGCRLTRLGPTRCTRRYITCKLQTAFETVHHKQDDHRKEAKLLDYSGR